VSPRLAAAVAIGLGLLAVIGATAAGSSAGLLETIVRPPALIHAGLVGGSAALAIVLLSRSVGRLAGGTDDVRGLIRGVRLAFLAVAAGAAGAGWALGHPLPLIVAAVIAGVDVVETSFLLLVVGRT
jgi:hypothetical protein